MGESINFMCFVSTVTISLPTMLIVNENAVSVQVCATLRDIFLFDGTVLLINVTLTTVDASAAADLDYVSLSEHIIFPENTLNDTELCIDVDIIDDDSIEANEMFFIELTPPIRGIVFENNLTAIIIIETDG